MLKLCLRCGQFKSHGVRLNGDFQSACVGCIGDVHLPVEEVDILPVSLNNAHIYFAQGVSGGPVKIGRTVCLSARLKSLQTGSPLTLKFVGVIPFGGAATEKTLHKKFANLHAHGEWFHPGEELLEYIKTYSSAPADVPDRVPPGEPSPSRYVGLTREFASDHEEDIALLKGLVRFIRLGGEAGRSHGEISKDHFDSSVKKNEIDGLLANLLCEGRVKKALTARGSVKYLYPRVVV